MPEKIKILVSGGGTGGHIFPAIAIANALKSKLKDIEILFVGAKGRMEMEKVPQSGYPIKGLWISGLQRKLDLSNLAFPFKLISSLIDRWWLEVSVNNETNTKYRRHQFVPCSYPDYQAAMKHEIPDRWWKVQQKLM